LHLLPEHLGEMHHRFQNLLQALISFGHFAFVSLVVFGSFFATFLVQLEDVIPMLFDESWQG
jgi:hypothetical protein